MRDVRTLVVAQDECTRVEESRVVAAIDSMHQVALWYEMCPPCFGGHGHRLVGEYDGVLFECANQNVFGSELRPGHEALLLDAVYHGAVRTNENLASRVHDLANDHVKVLVPKG